MSNRPTYLSGAQQQALMGAWYQIVGADPDMVPQHSGQPNNLQHGAYGGMAYQQPRYGVGDGVGPIPPRNALIDAPGPQRAGREVLPMSTGTEIFPFQSAQITARPQRVAFRPERVFISGSGTENGAADWIVNDIKIGNRSQFSQSGDVPGDMFANNSIDSFISFETAQTAMDVVMVVTYVGPNEGGANFYGAIIGTAAV